MAKKKKAQNPYAKLDAWAKQQTKELHKLNEQSRAKEQENKKNTSVKLDVASQLLRKDARNNQTRTAATARANRIYSNYQMNKSNPAAWMNGNRLQQGMKKDLVQNEVQTSTPGFRDWSMYNNVMDKSSGFSNTLQSMPQDMQDYWNKVREEENERNRKQQQESKDRASRIYSNYQMNKKNQAAWKSGNKLQQGMEKDLAPQKEQDKPAGFKDWSMYNNVMDESSQFNKLLKTRPKQEQKYWQGVKDEANERIRQQQDRADSMQKIGQMDPASRAASSSAKRNDLRNQSALLNQQTNKTIQGGQGSDGTTRPYNEQELQNQMADKNSPLNQIKAKEDARYANALSSYMAANKLLSSAYNDLGSFGGDKTNTYKMVMNPKTAQQIMQMNQKAQTAGIGNETGDIYTMDRRGRKKQKQHLENVNNMLTGQRIPRLQEEYEKANERWNDTTWMSSEGLEATYGNEYKAEYERYIANGGGGSLADFIRNQTKEELDKIENNLNYWETTVKNNTNEIAEIDRLDKSEEEYSLIMDPNKRKARVTQLQEEISELEQQIADVDANGGALAARDMKKKELKKQLQEKQEELTELGNYSILDDDIEDDATFHAEYDKGQDWRKGRSTETALGDSSVHGIYSFLNGGSEYEYWSHFNENEINAQYRGAMAMLPEEVEQFNKLYNWAISEGREPKEAQAFMDGLQYSLNQRMRPFEELKNKQEARTDPVTASYKSAMSGLLFPVYAVGTMIGRATGADYVNDPNNAYFELARYQGDVEGQVAKDLGDTGGFFYKAGMSAVKNFLRSMPYAGAGKLVGEIGTLAGFFGEDYYTSYQQKLEETGNADAAGLYAMTDAVISTFFEVASVEKTFSDPKSFLQQFLQVAGAEMSEEFFEGIFSPYIHELIDGSNEWKDNAAAIIKAGGYEDENGNWVKVTEDNANVAMEKALKDYSAQVFEGVMSAGISAGGPAAFSMARASTQESNFNKELGKKALNKNVEKGMTRTQRYGEQADNFNKLKEAAQLMPEDSEARKIADLIDENGKNKNKFNPRQVGRLVRAIVNESNEQIGEIAKNTLGDSLKQELLDAGENEQEAEMLSRILADGIVAQQNSPAMWMAISGNENAKRIWNEYRDSEAAKEAQAQIEPLKIAQKSVMDLIADPKEYGVSAEGVAGMMKGAQAATAEDIAEADAQGKRTGSALEVIADGLYGEITGFTTENVQDKDGKNQSVVKVQIGEGAAARTVDISQVKGLTDSAAQVLQVIGADRGQVIRNETAKTLMQIASKAKDVTGAVTDAMNTMWAAVMEQKAPKTNLDTTTQEAIANAVRADMDAAEAKRVQNWRAIKPGQGTTTFNGFSYGTQEFNDAIGKLGKTHLNEANVIGNYAKSMGMDVQLYYDANESAKQGAFYGGKDGAGIRINLAGTINQEGAHRSAVATFAHEATHNIEANSPWAYKALRSFVLQNLERNGMDLQKSLQHIMDNYAAHGESIDLNGAIAELVAMGSEQVLTNEDLAAKLKEQDPKLMRRVQKAVSDLVNRIRGVKGDVLTTSSRYARALQNVTNQMAQKWLAAYEEAKGTTAPAEAGTGEGKLSIRQYQGKVVNRDKTYFDNIVKSNDRMDVVTITDPEEIKLTNGKIDRQDIYKTVRENELVQVVKDNNGTEHFYAYVPDLKIYTELPADGIRHGFSRDLERTERNSEKAMLARYIPEMLQTAREVNRGNKNTDKDTNYEHVLVAPVRVVQNSKKTDYAVRITIDNKKTTAPLLKSMEIIGTLKGIAEKKTKLTGLRTSKGTRAELSSLEISIADFFNSVKNDMNDTFTKDAYRKAGVKRVENDYSKNLKWSMQDEDYMDAVNSGDMAAAQKMVDAAAKAAGYNYKAYHGTKSKFNAFRFTEDDIGIHLGTKGQARMMAGRGKDARIVNAYVKLQNPIHFDYDLGAWEGRRVAEQLYNMGIITMDEAANALLSADKSYRLGDEAATKNIRNLLISKGYDGFTYDNEFEGYSRKNEESIAVFNPNQIKVADPVTYDNDGNVIPLSERFNDQKKDIRWSMQDDADYMDAVNSGDMEDAQKIVDAAAKKAGYTMKVYHGTPTGGFTVFRDWSYFTENKAYADRYNHASASSIRGSYETTTPQTYELYMNPGKVFDTRNAKERKLYNEARMEYGLNGLDNMKRGLPDWTDGRDIIEFLEDRGLDYDTILLDEGGDGGYGAEVVDRGISYVSRSNMVKSAETVTYDNDGNIIPPSERFNTQKNDIRWSISEEQDNETENSITSAENTIREAQNHPVRKFSMQDPVEVRNDGLIAVHNLTARNLFDTLQEGGFTAPSIAVIVARMGHTKYGEISAVFKPSAIDPKQSRRNKVYGTDAWTPTRSNAQIETRLNYEVLQNARDTIRDTLKGTEWQNEALNWINRWLYDDQTTDTMDDMIDRAYRNDGMIAAYYAAKGRTFERKTKYEQVHPDVHEQFTGQYNAFLNKLDEKGLLQEFINDVHNETGNYVFNKYLETFRESGEELSELVDKYEKNQSGMAKRIIFARMRAAEQFQQDGRQILTDEVYDKLGTIDDARNNIDKKDFDKWISGMLDGALGERGVYNGSELFTRSGNRRSFRATHDEPTAENIVRAMYANHEAKGGEAGGATGLMAKASKEYGSLDEIRADAGRLQVMEDEEYKALVSALDDKLNNLAERISQGTGIDYYTVKGILIEAGEAYAKQRTAAAIDRHMRQEGIKLTQGQLEEAQQMIEEAQNIPTGYFEAKPETVKNFDELEKIIMPEDEQLESMLDEREIPYEIYDGTEEDRLRILNEQTNAIFSFQDDTDYDVKAWMETVPEWSLRTEAEKALLRNYGSLRRKNQMDGLRMEKIDAEIRRLEGMQGKSATAEGTPVVTVTVDDVLQKNGIVQDGAMLKKGGVIIGSLRMGVLNIYDKYKDIRKALQNSGAFEYDEKTESWTTKAQNIHADQERDVQKRLDALRIKKQNLQGVMDQTSEQLAQITGSEGFGAMMYQQRKVLDKMDNFRTQKELTDAVKSMEAGSKRVQGIIDENRRKAEELAGSDVVKQFRQLLGTTTADQTAADLKKEFSSTWTKKQIREFLDPIILKMKSGEDFTQDVETLAGILVNSDSRNGYEELEALRGLTITLGKGAQAELRAKNSSLKEIRARLAGTGITVKYGERSTLEADIEDLRAEYPMIPELGDEKDALENFVSWVEGMKNQSAGNEFYDQRIAEAMAMITGKAAGAAKGIYMPNDPKAQRQVLAMMDFVKALNAETQQAQAALQKVADEMAAVRKAGKEASGKADVLMRDVNVALDYYNRISRIAVEEAKQKRNNAMIEQLKSETAQKIIKNNEEWRALIQRDADARKQLEDNRKAAAQINTSLKRMYNLLKNPKGTKNIPEYMQGLAREVLGIFAANDADGGRRFLNATKDGLAEMQRLLAAWEKQDGPFNPADLAAAEEAVVINLLQDLDIIRDGIAAINTPVKGKNKLDTLQQRGATIKSIQEAVSEIYSAIRAEQEVQIGDRRVAVEDAAYKVAAATQGKNYREWTGKLGGVVKTLHKAIISGNMTPEYFFRTIGNEGLSDLWSAYHWAENKNGLELAKAQARLDEIAKQHGYKNWDMGQTIKLDLESGETELTLGQIMSLWATWKRERTLGPQMSEHLTKGGFFAEKDLRDGWLGRTTIERKAHRVTEADMAKVKDLMTDEQRKFVDDVVLFMSRDMSQLGNEASMAAYGIKMYKEAYYFPFQMWDGVKSRKSNDAGSAAGANDRAFHPSFSKSRMHGANNALVIGDFMQTAADHIAGMINYATMGLANESMQKVLNQQTAQGPYETKRNTRAILEEAYGREVMQYLAELQNQLNGGAVKVDKTFYDKLISLFRKNAVAGSLSVALQQPLSYIRAGMMVNSKYLAAAMNPATWKGSYQEMMAHSGVAVIKNMGRFDMNFGQSAREYLLPEGKESTGKKIWNGIEEYTTILPELMDRMTWTRMWSAVKAEQAAEHPEMDVKSDEFLDVVGERFNELMRRTQVYDSVLVKSANMRSQHTAVKALTSFMAEPTLTLNVLADAMREATSGAKGGKMMLAKAGATFLLSAVLQAAVKGLMGSGRTPDEKKTWLENFMYRFVYNFMNEADPLQLIPGFSDLVTILKDGELKDDAYGSLTKMWKATTGTVDLLLGNGKNGVYRDLEDSVGQLVQLFTGVPAKNLMRDGRAMWNWFIDQPYAKRESNAGVMKYQTVDTFFNADNIIGTVNKWMGDAGYKTNNDAYYKRIYAAKKTGNEQKAQDMIDYLLKGKGVDAETLKSKMATLAKKDTSATAEETAGFLLDNGKDPTDYIKEQLKAGSMNAEDARKLLQDANPDKSADDAWWTVDRIQYQIEKGLDKTPGGSYYRLWDAMDANSTEEIRTAIGSMMDHGLEVKNIKKKITEQYKAAYLDADSDGKRKIRDAIEKAYKLMGLTAEDADKVINKWK